MVANRDNVFFLIKLSLLALGFYSDKLPGSMSGNETLMEVIRLSIRGGRIENI